MRRPDQRQLPLDLGTGPCPASRRRQARQLALLPDAEDAGWQGQRLMTARALLRRFGHPPPPPRLVSVESLCRLVARA